ncbi:MAG: glycosyltransferase family 2 protein [Firmicutes bacterium]|mgnify:FL=1|jgi:cellulose synthase/poly-beta-1,6-N-acetylglucosamine synthase-like glycosyltransferase|nr:glycosyltransferase family 2 protein [Bacillota bacterium]
MVSLIISLAQGIVLCFGIYFLLLALAGLASKRCRREHAPRSRFAILIPAHNEARVIGKLIENLLQLDYPRRLYDIFVIADNCDDDTALVARRLGVSVWERFSRSRRGKGYALADAFKKWGLDRTDSPYDAAVIFDADNLVAPNFLRVMNNRLLEGEKLIQCYVDSKNPGDNWITAAYSITFWYNNRFLLLARYNLGLSAALAGTGACISREVLNTISWTTATLTEDLEYSMQALLKGYRTSFALETRIYDEKPLHFIQSCRQRLRWARGQINVAIRYALPLLLKGFRRGNAAQIEGGLRLLQLFVLPTGALLALLGIIFPETNAGTLYAYLSSNHPYLGLLLAAVPYLLPLLTMPLDSLPRRPFLFYPFYPVFCLSWLLLIFIALFSWRNSRWMPTAHSRAIDYHELKHGFQKSRPASGCLALSPQDKPSEI